MRLGLWAAALALAAGPALAGCGGGGDAAGTADGGSRGQDAPRDASVEEFCAAYEETRMMAGDEAADILVETGTPTDIPEDARSGFEYLIDHPEGGENVLNNEDFKAYVAWGGKTCLDFINN